MKMDQGTENQGAAKQALAEDSIMMTESHVDRHTDQYDIENLFNRVQTCAATIGVGAFGDNEGYNELTIGTRIAHAADLLKYRPCNKTQRDTGVTPIEEQFHPQCLLEIPKIAYGTLTFMHIEKKDRANKSGPRAVMAIYAGECKRVKGNIIVHPISPNAEYTAWNIYESLSINRWTTIDGYMILKFAPGAEGIPEAPSSATLLTYDEITNMLKLYSIDSEDLAEGEEEVDYLKDHTEEGKDEYFYLVAWKGHDSKADTWHHQDDLQGCGELIMEYWQAQQRNEIMNCTTDSHNSSPDNIIAFINQTEGYDFDAKPCKPAMMCVGTLNQGKSQIMALSDWQVDSMLGDRMRPSIMAVGEIKPKDFYKMDGGPEAIEHELDEMRKQRFNNAKPVP